MDKLTINALYLGRIKTKKLNLVKTPDKEENLYSPIVAFLIRHPQLGNILYDTGNSKRLHINRKNVPQVGGVEG